MRGERWPIVTAVVGLPASPNHLPSADIAGEKLNPCALRPAPPIDTSRVTFLARYRTNIGIAVGVPHDQVRGTGGGGHPKTVRGDHRLKTASPCLRPPRPIEMRCQAIHCGLLRRRCDMAVDVHRRGDRGVPKTLLNDLGVLPKFEQQGRVRLPKALRMTRGSSSSSACARWTREVQRSASASERRTPV